MKVILSGLSFLICKRAHLGEMVPKNFTGIPFYNYRFPTTILPVRLGSILGRTQAWRTPDNWVWIRNNQKNEFRQFI
jgi:hypothetical protein